MNIKILPNNSILKNKIMIELNCNLISALAVWDDFLFSRERDQYERRVVELDRQLTQNDLQIQAQNKDKENLLVQVFIVRIRFLRIAFFFV